MALLAFDRLNDLDELAVAVDVGSGVRSVAQRQANALINLGLAAAGAVAPPVAGTVGASAPVVVDSNKDISSFRNLTAVNLKAGSSGAVGTLDVFPATASKGKLEITASDNTTDTTTAVVVAAQAAARTYTLPDAGASASFVMTQGAQTLTGVKTFASNPALSAGITLKLDSSTATLTGNAATVTSYSNLFTTAALTTAAGASQAFVITLTGVAAGDFAYVQETGGGTNTRHNHTYEAVCTLNTVTVTVFNNEPVNAINGTLKFNMTVFKL